jgi:hypothetical protein
MMRLTDYDREQGRWVELSDGTNKRRYNVGQQTDDPPAIHAAQFSPGAELKISDVGRTTTRLPDKVYIEWTTGTLHATKGGANCYMTTYEYLPA